MVGGDVGDLGQAHAVEPFVCVIVMKIRYPGGVAAAAAELADIVAQGSRADHGEVHRQPRLLGLTAHVQGHIVDADGVGGRVEGHDLPAEAHQLLESGLGDRFLTGGVLVRDQAVFKLLRREGGDVRQRVQRAAALLRVQEPPEHREIEFHGLPSAIGQLPSLRVRIQPVSELQIAFLQPAALRLFAQAVHDGPTPIQHLGAADAAAPQLPGEPLEEPCFLQKTFDGCLRQLHTAEPARNEQLV